MPSTISCTHNFDFNHVIFDSAHVASLATAFAGIPDLNSTGRTADDNGVKPDGRKKIKGKLEKPPVLQHNSTQPLYIGVDLSHKYYQVAVADDTAFYNICLTPDAFTEFIRNNAGRNYCIAMEACGSSNYWSSFAGQNEFIAHVFPADVCRGFATGFKDDATDALGVLHALTMYRTYPDSIDFRECIQRDQNSANMRFALKYYWSLKNQCEALIRKAMAFLRERDPLKPEYSLSVSVSTVVAELEKVLFELAHKEQNSLSDTLITTCMTDIINSLQNCMRIIRIFDCVLFPEYIRQNKICRLIMDCPGVGPALAVAISITINDDYFRFKNARDFAAFFGVIPSHSGTGGKNRNGRMSTKGDTTVRRLLFESAQSVATAQMKEEMAQRRDEIKKNPKLKDEIRQKYFGSKKYRCKLSNQIIQNVWERVNAAACNSEALIRKLHEQGITFDKLSEFDQQTRRQFYDFITGLEADEKFEQAKDHIKKNIEKKLARFRSRTENRMKRMSRQLNNNCMLSLLQFIFGREKTDSLKQSYNIESRPLTDDERHILKGFTEIFKTIREYISRKKNDCDFYLKHCSGNENFQAVARAVKNCSDCDVLDVLNLFDLEHK